MALANEVLSTEELLEAQAHVWNHMFNFINSMSLKCALQLGIPDTIQKHGKPMPLSELVNALPMKKSKSDGIDRLMRILIHSKFFVKVNISDHNDELEGYWLTPSSRLLMRNEPFSISPFVLLVTDPLLTDPWHCMSEWFKNDDLTTYATYHKRAFWEHAGQEPRVNKLFNEAMASDAQLVTSLLIKDSGYVFEGLKSMVDIAGGTGKVAKVIAEAFPGLKCSVLELPHVVRGLEGNEKLTFVAGDMFKSIPPADAVFLKWILHDWNDEECVKILKNCKEAIPNKENGGKVIIIDIIVDEQKQSHEAVETQLLFDMLMLMMVPGRERTEKEWAKLFSDAGFSSYNITPVLGLRSLIQNLGWNVVIFTVRQFQEWQV